MSREALRCASKTVSHSNSRAVRRNPTNRSSLDRVSQNRSEAARHRINHGESRGREDGFHFLTDRGWHKFKVESPNFKVSSKYLELTFHFPL
jgi:hypothetical protein